MTKQEIFDFLAENLRLSVGEKDFYRPYSKEIRINLYLKDPKDGQELDLGGGYFSVEKESESN